MAIYGGYRDEEPIHTLRRLWWNGCGHTRRQWDASRVKEYIMSAKGEQFDVVLVDQIMTRWE